MGKASRRKRQPAAPAVPSVIMLLRSPKIDDFTGPELGALMTETLRAANVEAKQQRENDRKNNLPIGHHDNVHRIDETFSPIEALLENIVFTGDIDVSSKGQPLLLDPKDNVWYPMVPALVSMCDTFTQLARQFSWDDQTADMRRLAKKLDVQMPLFIKDIDGARACLVWMREKIRQVTPQQFSNEAIEIQIRDELAELRIAA